MQNLKSLFDAARKRYRRYRNFKDLEARIAPAVGINFHRRNPKNVGDLRCGPAEYVDFLHDFKTIEIFRCRRPMKLADKPVIVGGGGLLANEFFAEHIDNIVRSRPKLLVCWGAGQNAHHSDAIRYPESLKHFDLVGLRDHGNPYDWVPCVSCLHEGFDKPHAIEHELVLYNHSEFASLRNSGFPELSNDEMDLDRIIAFLGSGATVLTTSYHGAYWATLLGRKVVVLDPFSSKFHAYRHPPALVSSDDWREGVRRAIAYPEALEECRSSNTAFAAKVRERLGR